MKELNFEQQQANQVFDLGDNTLVIRVAKAGYQQELKLSELAQSSVLELLRYGAQRWLNDKTGGSEKSAEDVENIIKDNMEALLSPDGWQASTRRVAGISLSPIDKIIQDIASEKVKGAIRAKGLTLKEVGKEKIAELVENYISANHTTLESIAKTQLEQTRALDSISLDL